MRSDRSWGLHAADIVGEYSSCMHGLEVAIFCIIILIKFKRHVGYTARNYKKWAFSDRYRRDWSDYLFSFAILC